MKNCIKVVLFCLIAMMIIFSVDYYVDSYAVLRITYKQIAEMLDDGNVIVGKDIPISERKMKWARINDMEKREFVILGSSRSAMFSADDWEESSFYNLWTSGGCTVNDYLAEVYLLYEQDKLPKMMLIEISPSIFNANADEQRYVEWENNVDCMRAVLYGEENIEKYERKLGIGWKDLISPAYFQYNFEELLEGNRTQVKYTEERIDTDNNIYWSDGGFAYSSEYAGEYSAEEIAEDIERICLKRSIYACSNYNEIDGEYRECFEKLMDFLLEQDVELYFYLPPYAEPMYAFVISDDAYAVIPEVEDYIMEFAQVKGISVYGSYNPEKSGLSLLDFYDSYHIRDEKVMDTVWLR